MSTHLRAASTCRSHGLRDIWQVNQPVRQSDKDINSFFNTSGIKYRQLNLKDKLKTMTEDEKIEILSSDGMLVKRPILVLDNHVLVGFKITEWENFL